MSYTQVPQAPVVITDVVKSRTIGCGNISAKAIPQEYSGMWQGNEDLGLGS